MTPRLRQLAGRFLRPAASAACFLSLLLCLAACWLWSRSRDPDPFVLSLARAQRTYEVRSRDGRLSVLRIDGQRPGSTPAGVVMDASTLTLLQVLTPPPPVKSGFAGVQVERGQLQALEGTAIAWPPDLSLALTGNPTGQIWGGSDGRLTRRTPPVASATIGTEFLYHYAGTHAGPSPVTAVRVSVPYPLLAGAAALPPVLWLALAARGAWSARRAVRRRRAGLCPACGYDLRGSPASGRCPECGRAASPALPPSAATPDAVSHPT